MTVIRNFGVAGVANTIEFGKQGGTLNYDNATKVFSFALSSALTIPSGTNAQRPTSGTLGMLRVNTEGSPTLELYNGTSWTAVGSGSGTTGTVTSVSVVSANGFTGTVANSTSTAAITLQTTVSGLIKGVSGTLVAASTTTDYQVPLALTTTGTGAASFNGRVLNIPTPVAGVTQILAGNNITVQASGSSGTGIVSIGVTTSTASSLTGGLANQIPYQSAPSVTQFSQKFTWNNTSNTLALGEFAGTAVITGVNSATSFPGSSLLIKGGNANALSAAGMVTISGGEGFGSDYRGGNLVLQGGIGGTLGSGDIVFRSSDSTGMYDRFRILANGAWSVGPNSLFTGEYGQVLTSFGPDQPPSWQPISGGGGVSQILAGEGIAITPETGLGTVTITATGGGGGGGGTPGGSSGQLQYNNAGEFSGTTDILYTSGTLTVGSANSTFTITTLGGSFPETAGDLVIKTGDQYGSALKASSITIAGGNSFDQEVNGGSIIIAGGRGANTDTSVGGSLYFRTGNDDAYDRLTIDESGAWGLNGPNYGTSGQVLTSQGPGQPPVWLAGGGGGGGTGSGVTLVNVTGGSTGLTTSGGPITSAGTITLGGVLNVASGGTGRSTIPGVSGSLFFNNNNTLDAIAGMTYDGAGKLYINNIALSTDDVFTEFTPVNPIIVQPGTGRNTNAFGGNITVAGGDLLSTINRAGSAIIAGGVNTTASKSGYVILRTNNFDRFTISETGAWGVPGGGGPNYGTPGQILSSQGPNSPPVWRSGGGGTGTAGVIAITTSPPLFTDGGDTPNISLGTVPTTNGGTGYSNYITGDMLWARNATTLETLNIGAPGQVLTVLNGRPQWSSSLAGVQSFSGGNTGLTPATYTTGLITLGGRLNISFGGTGANNKTAAFNNLAPTQFSGDIIYYDANGGNKRLALGASGTILTSGSSFPEWRSIGGLPGGLPVQSGNYGKFLTTTETGANSGAVWSDLITFSGNYEQGSNSINISATDARFAFSPGGSVNITAGNDGGAYSGGNVTLYLGNAGRFSGNDPYAQGSFNVYRKPSTLLFTINNAGAIGIGGNTTGSYGLLDQVLTSRGPNQLPEWTNSGVPNSVGQAGKYLTNDGTKPVWASDIVNQIVAGNSNIVVTPVTGTGIVTLSVVGEGFQGVTSFSAGTTGFLPTSATTGPVVLTGTLLTTSGGTGINTYAVGDLLYANTTTSLTKLPIGSNGRLLASNGSVPYWTDFTGLPDQTNKSGQFLTTNGTAASWSSKIVESGPSVSVSANNNLGPGDGAGGNVQISAGSASGSGGGGGIITLQVGADATAGYLVVKSPSTEFFRWTRFGSISLGPSGTNTGNFGQVLTSTGPNTPPVWTTAGQGLPDQTGYAGFYLTTDGSTASWIAVPGGTGAPGGSSGQLQYNNAGAFAGTQQIILASANTLRLGNANTFSILGANSPDNNIQPGANLLLQAGTGGATTLHGSTAIAGSVTIQGGSGKVGGSEGSAGNVFINGGTCGTATTATIAGYVSIGTGITTTERVRFNANGSWSVAGGTGIFGQALVSGGASSPPLWRSIVNRIIAGNNITISSTIAGGNGDVTINASAAPSTASTTTLGVIKVGSGLSITPDGVLSATGGGGGAVTSVSATNGVTTTATTGSVLVTGVPATTSTIGMVKIGRGLSISSTGTISVPPEEFELAFSATGLTGNGTIFIYTSTRTFVIPRNMAGSSAVSLNPSTNNMPLQIFQLESSTGIINNIGSITFLAGQFTGIFTFGSDVTFNPGDTLFMRINVGADATLGNIAVSIAAILT